MSAAAGRPGGGARTAKPRVLILCTGNSARSQMAEALLRHDSGGGCEVFSAGTRPGALRPEAIAVMAELGLDLSAQRSKSVDEFRGQGFDFVVTVCDHARETCPVFPGGQRRHRSFDDPAAATGSAAERLAAFRRVRDELRAWLGEEFPAPPQGRVAGRAAPSSRALKRKR